MTAAPALSHNCLRLSPRVGSTASPPPALRSIGLRRLLFPAPVIAIHTYPKLDSDLLVGEVVPFLFTWEQHYSDPTALSGVDQ